MVVGRASGCAVSPLPRVCHQPLKATKTPAQAQAQEPLQPPRSDDVSFLTYNLFHIHTKFRSWAAFPSSDHSRDERVKKQAVEMKRLGPTFILVQEAFHNKTREKLVEEMADVYGVVNNHSYNVKDGLIQYGSGLLIFYKKSEVKYIDDSCHFIKFPRDKGTFIENLFAYKGLLNAHFEKGGKHISVSDVHLASLDVSGHVRLAQTQWILDQLQQEDAVDLQIIGGDFNTDFMGPRDPSIQKMDQAFDRVKAVSKFSRADKPSWEAENTMIKLSLWPESDNQLIDYLFVRSPNHSYELDKASAKITMKTMHPIHGLEELIEDRLDKVEESIQVLRERIGTSRLFCRFKKLEEFLEMRIRDGAKGWTWLKEAESFDPDGRVRAAIDELFLLTQVNVEKIFAATKLKSEQIFMRNPQGCYLSHLSDHYGVMAAARPIKV